jgi:hypothetical protein
MQTAKEGAQTSIYLAVSDEVSQVSGQYFVECQVKNCNMDKRITNHQLCKL